MRYQCFEILSPQVLQMIQSKQSVLISNPQQQILLDQFQIQSTNKTITFSTLKKIYLNTLSNQTVTEEVLNMIQKGQKFKEEGITVEQFLAYIKIISRELSNHGNHVQDSHSFGIYMGTQLVKLVNNSLIIEKQQEQLPVYKVPKELQWFLHEPDLTVRYSNDLISQYERSKLSYKKIPETFRLWNFQIEANEKNSTTFKRIIGNKYSQLLRSAFGLEFKFMLDTINEMEDKSKQLRILKMITNQFINLQASALADRDLNQFFKRQAFPCKAFEPNTKKVAQELTRNKAQFLIKWCESLSKIIQNHYIKAIMTYWGNQRNWAGEMFSEISFNHNICLVDRFFFAKWNMSKQVYPKFVEEMKEIGRKSSKLEYILLFGKRSESAQILQNYYDQTLDIETVALLSKYFIIGQFDGKTSKHQNVYEYLLQTYKLSLKNSNKNITLQIFEKKERQIQAEQNVIDNRAISMRCNNCGCNLSLLSEIKEENTKSAQKKQLTTFSILQKCPFCGEHVHRCSTCLTPVEVRNPTFKTDENKKAEGYKKESIPIEMGLVFCIKCKHGGHFYHIYEWFIHETTCPIPQCGCQCYL